MPSTKPSQLARVTGRVHAPSLLLTSMQLNSCLCDCVDGMMCRFHVPHINVGDLLYAEVAAKTPLGLEAQRHMDSSKTVPDRLLMKLLLERLQHADCQTQGWVLDGFPHTRKQVRLVTSWTQAGCPHTIRHILSKAGPKHKRNYAVLDCRLLS